MGLTSFLSPLLVGVMTVLLIVSTATPNWVFSKANNQEVGFWQVCDSNGNTCQNISDSDLNNLTAHLASEWRGARAMGICGAIVGVFSFFALCLVALSSAPSSVRIYGGVLCCVLTWIFSLVQFSLGVDIFSQSPYNSQFQFGYSMVLNLLSWIVGIFAVLATVKYNTT